MVKAFFILVLALAAAGVGNLCLSRGMQAMGPFAWENFSAAFAYFSAAVANPWVIVGILCEITYFILWLGVLSMADVSWAVPMNAVEYIFVALFAQFWLGEQVAFTRWIGIGLISVGVAFMMHSFKENPDELGTQEHPAGEGILS